MSNNLSVRRVALANVEAEGLISLREVAKLGGVTTLTANKRLTKAGLSGTGVVAVAYATAATVGRPARLFPRQAAVLAVSGDNAGVEADAILGAVASSTETM